LDKLPFTKEAFVSLINLIDSGKINSKQAKEVLAEMLATGANPADVVKAKGMEQISDAAAVQSLVDAVLAKNQQSVSDWQHGKDHALGYLVGQVMALSHGKANPSLAKELIIKVIGPCVKPK
jgi:aspartyl-tRNA(Asn)/glutamyl-tRNA(Gln) amidotransferase subunit B